MFSLEGGRVYFRFDDSYANDPQRPILSMLYQAFDDQAEARIRAQLQPLSRIKDKLPFALREDSRNFLLVHRYDRDADTPSRRRHAEDFAQANAIAPDDKYSGTYTLIGKQLLRWSTEGRADVLELMRRIKINELLGNFDAHLKNFILLYSPDGRSARFSPAYDIVAYAVYLGGGGHGLRFMPEQKRAETLAPRQLRVLASEWKLPETILAHTLRETVDRAMQAWPVLFRQSPLPEHKQSRLAAFITRSPAAISWFKRHPVHDWAVPAAQA